MEPTEAQNKIINYIGNTVISAFPGSGKTFVLSQKIRNILSNDDIQEYEGVIAISFTKKAANNLKTRVLGSGFNPKNSNFTTISTFCLNQIIRPFANYVWGYPKEDIQIINKRDLDAEEYLKYKWIENHPTYRSIPTEQLDDLAELFKLGRVLISTIDVLALHILNNCVACRNYLKARYKYVLIDEYQDADTYINELFLSLVGLGMEGTVVGDERQAIFGFANKSNHYLMALKDRADFKNFVLTDNFRCSQPIINYSNRLLDSKYKCEETDEDGMYLVRVTGAEAEIANYIDNQIESIMNQWGVKDRNECAILVRNERTQNIIHANLKTPNRVSRTTPLDEDINFSSGIYSELLKYKFDQKIDFLEIIEVFIDYGDLKQQEKEVLGKIGLEIRNQPISSEKECRKLVDIFNRFIKVIFEDVLILERSKDLLMEVLNDTAWIESYKPSSKDEINIMTLHKSKGLEFDVVFHLNLNEWEIPYQKLNVDKSIEYPSFEEDLYLHYVGITRARKACYLMRSSERTNRDNQMKRANDSCFLGRNGLRKLRKDLQG